MTVCTIVSHAYLMYMGTALRHNKILTSVLHRMIINMMLYGMSLYVLTV